MMHAIGRMLFNVAVAIIAGVTIFLLALSHYAPDDAAPEAWELVAPE